MSDPVNDSLAEAGTKLGLTLELETRVTWLGGRRRVPDVNRFALSGHIDGHLVNISRDAQLRDSDPIPPNALRFAVACDVLKIPFRISTFDFHNPGAVELRGTTHLAVETDALYAIEQFLTPTRHRVLRLLFERWPVFEVQHDHVGIVESDVATDADAVIDTMQLLLGAAHAFRTDHLPE